MFTLEFEVPMELFNQVVDTLVLSEASIEWVYHNERRNSAVFRVSAPKDCLEWCLLRLAAVIAPMEVSVVESQKMKTYIHDAFLIRLEVSSKPYPVVILFKYYGSPFYPSDIVVVTLPNSPAKLLDAVLNLTLGRVSIGAARIVGRTVSNNVVVIHLKTQEAKNSYPNHAITLS
jgi:hypothetical protein